MDDLKVICSKPYTPTGRYGIEHWKSQTMRWVNNEHSSNGLRNIRITHLFFINHIQRNSQRSIGICNNRKGKLSIDTIAKGSNVLMKCTTKRKNIQNNFSKSTVIRNRKLTSILTFTHSICDWRSSTEWASTLTFLSEKSCLCRAI